MYAYTSKIVKCTKILKHTNVTRKNTPEKYAPEKYAPEKYPRIYTPDKYPPDNNPEGICPGVFVLIPNIYNILYILRRQTQTDNYTPRTIGTRATMNHRC